MTDPFNFKAYYFAAEQAIEIEHLRKRVAELEKQNAHLAMLAAETGTWGKAAPGLIQIATPGGAGGAGGEGGARRLKVCSLVPDSVHPRAPPPT